MKENDLKMALVLDRFSFRNFHISNKFKTVYLGSDTCENKLLSFEELSYFRRKNPDIKIVLLLPLAFGKKADHFFSLILKAWKRGLIDEVSLNDPGLIFRLIEEDCGLAFNIGRLAISYFGKSTGCGVIKKLFSSGRISAYEADSENSAGFIPVHGRAHLYTPFEYLCHTRNCAFIDNAQGDCNGKCQGLYHEIKGGALPDMVISGNTYLRKNEPSVKNLEKKYGLKFVRIIKFV